MWFIFGLTFAITSAFGTIIAKSILKDSDEYAYIWLSSIFTLPFLFGIILIFYQIPAIDRTFIFAVLGSLSFDVIAALVAFRAIKISEISLINPMSAFNPVFVSIISFFTLGERIGIKGLLGILLIVAGAYLLQASKAKGGFLAPLRALLTHKGVQYSLIAYFLWAITPTFQKTAIFHTTPQVPPFASFIGLLGMTLVYTPLTVKFSRKPLAIARKYFKLLILFGVLGAVAQVAAFTAFSLTKLGFATAVFKLSMIFTVILGWLIFKEKDIKSRLLGSTVMLTGVILLVT